MATAKHKFQKLVFNPANHKLVDFPDELQKLAKDAFGIAAQAIIEQFIYAKLPPHLKKSKNQAHLENGTYEQIVTHLEKELELNGLETPVELQINTVSHNAVNSNADGPKPTCHHCEKPGHYRIQCRLLKKQREQTEKNQNFPGNKNSDGNTSNASSNVNNHNNNNKNSNRAEKSRKLFIHLVRHVARQTIPQRNATTEPMQPIDRLPGKKGRKDKMGSKKEPIKMTRMTLLRLQPEF